MALHVRNNFHTSTVTQHLWHSVCGFTPKTDQIGDKNTFWSHNRSMQILERQRAKCVAKYIGSSKRYNCEQRSFSNYAYVHASVKPSHVHEYFRV